MKNKKTWITAVLVALLLLAGLSLLLYPTASNYWNTIRQARSILSYDDEIVRLEETENRRLLQEAEDYNRSLLERPSAYSLTEAQQTVYPSTLLAGSSDVMAYLEIPSIDVKLPILHGVEADTLQRAVGHLEWSSLPVGGESTHCVLSGHRGLPSSELLTNIDRLTYGDVFYIHVLGRRLEYRVERITVVEPGDLSQLAIVPGVDCVTLLTCTPYGINSHRLLVTGVRIQTDRSGGAALELTNETKTITLPWLMPVLLGALGITVLFLILPLDGKKKKKGDTP